MINRCDMEVVEAYNGLYFPLENKNKKKGLGRINKIIWGSTNGLLVKSLKQTKRGLVCNSVGWMVSQPHSICLK